MAMDQNPSSQTSFNVVGKNNAKHSRLGWISEWRFWEAFVCVLVAQHLLFLYFWSSGVFLLGDVVSYVIFGVSCILGNGFRSFQQSHRSWNTQFTEQLNYSGSSLKEPGSWWRFPSRGWEVTENNQQGNCVSTYATMRISHWSIVGQDQGLFCGLICFAYSVFQTWKFGKLFYPSLASW